MFGLSSVDCIGTYLRAQSGLESEHRVRVGAASSPSHTESLLVIGDAIQRIRNAYDSRQSGVHSHQVFVADGYTLAHLAHGLALLPEGSGATLEQCMSHALTEILAPLRHIAHVQQTIFLRISPQMAVQRLEHRMSTKLSAASCRFVVRIAEIYDELLRTSRATEVDAHGSPDEVARRIKEAIGA